MQARYFHALPAWTKRGVPLPGVRLFRSCGCDFDWHDDAYSIQYGLPNDLGLEFEGFWYMARAKAPDRLAATFTMRTGNLILEASEGPFSVPA